MSSGYGATLVGDALGSLAGVESMTFGDLETRFDEVTVLDAYRTGTATFTNGSTTVTGSGTAWTSEMEGRQVRLDADGTLVTIADVGSTTSITLASAYSDTGGSGAYTIMPSRVVENLPLSTHEGPVVIVLKYNKTVYETLHDAAEAQTEDEFTVTDSGASTHIGQCRVGNVGGINLDSQGHATFSLTLQPTTTFDFTP